MGISTSLMFWLFTESCYRLVSVEEIYVGCKFYSSYLLRQPTTSMQDSSSAFCKAMWILDSSSIFLSCYTMQCRVWIVEQHATSTDGVHHLNENFTRVYKTLLILAQKAVRLFLVCCYDAFAHPQHHSLPRS